MKEIIIDGKKFVEAKDETLTEYSIIRTYSAGVHFGVVAKREGREITLKNARRIWYWDGAASLSQMALEGVKKPENCKFSVSLPEILLLEGIEVIPCTEAATKSLLAVPDWRVD
ncbi:hypothetical protein EB077_13435 [bacterium]|nr:hypothetical protein [bacterium]NDC96303.1 hypothetical protein [bacterium]NDG19978.1 hypothetical protein [Betaproteobacteria bacterium]